MTQIPVQPEVLAIPCPKCDVRPRVRCVSGYGGTTTTHKARRDAAQKPNHQVSRP